VKKFDYEKKISGIKDDLSIEILKPRVSGSLPNELIKTKGKVLDVGCGAGNYTVIIKKSAPKLKVYGVDISKQAIKKAKKDFPDINFSVAGANKLPFPNNSYNAVVMKCVLEHLKNPSKALAEVKRVLKPGGLFYSITPLEGEKYILNSSKELSWKYQGHYQRFSKESILSLFENNGFQVEKHYFWGYLLCQIISFAYYIFLDIFNFPPHFSVISCVNEGDYSLPKRLLSYLRNAISFLINIESLIIPKKIPGLFIHIIARKRQH
jgi:ubiquinone/menaquinone biosynthesis C-methylase UbiE